MPETTDVLVIGGGLMGCSTAYHLAHAGVKTTLVERRSEPGQETTARSGAIIRAHYGVPALVRLALEANHRYARFDDEVGLPCGFVRSGYSVLVDEADAPNLRDITAMHQSLGVNAHLLPPAALKEMIPALHVQDAALAAWEPEGGYASPAQTVAAYAARAKDLGADLLFDAPVTAAVPEGTGWRVTLGDGTAISAGQVVLCTGNWSRPVSALFGLDLPVTPVRAQIVVLERPASFSGVFPVVSDLINLAYFRSDGESGTWVGSSDNADLLEALDRPEDYDETTGAQAVEDARRKAALRFEGMGMGDKGGVQRAFSGLYETTPDWQPIMDSFPGGLHAAVGFSGHGFKMAPVVGELMAARAQGCRTRSTFRCLRCHGSPRRSRSARAIRISGPSFCGRHRLTLRGLVARIEIRVFVSAVVRLRGQKKKTRQRPVLSPRRWTPALPKTRISIRATKPPLAQF